MSRTRCWKRGESELCQRTLKVQRDAAFPSKALLACQISCVHNRGPELLQEGGQVSRGDGSSRGRQNINESSEKRTLKIINTWLG